MIATDRLILIPCTREHLEAFARGHADLGVLIGATVPQTFPVFPESFLYWLEIAQVAQLPVGWANWVFVHKADRVAIGDGGFKGAPNEQGEVEIGYAIIDDYRQQGYAREAAGALVAWAFTHLEVTAVKAETLVSGDASMRVLAAIGMQRTGDYLDPSEGRIVTWLVTRKVFEAARSGQAE